jgi:prenyltransferase beta subunit
MYSFLISVKNQNGSFRMSKRGETDLRGSYIAVIIAESLKIATPELYGIK